MDAEDLNVALQQAETDKELNVISATEQKVSGSASELRKISQTSSSKQITAGSQSIPQEPKEEVSI
jgi:hypothetical protein